MKPYIELRFFIHIEAIGHKSLAHHGRETPLPAKWDLAWRASERSKHGKKHTMPPSSAYP